MEQNQKIHPAQTGENHRERTEPVAGLTRKEKQRANIDNHREPPASKLQRTPKRVLSRGTIKHMAAVQKLNRQEKLPLLIVDNAVPIKNTLNRPPKQSLQRITVKGEHDSTHQQKDVTTMNESAQAKPFSPNVATNQVDREPNAPVNNPLESNPSQKQISAKINGKEKLSPYELAELLSQRYIIKSFSAQERLSVYVKELGYYKIMKKSNGRFFCWKHLEELRI